MFISRAKFKSPLMVSGISGSPEYPDDTYLINIGMVITHPNLPNQEYCLTTSSKAEKENNCSLYAITVETVVISFSRLKL